MIIAKPKTPSSASIVARPLCLTTPPLTPTKVGQTSSSLSSNDSAFVEDLEEIQPLVQTLKTPHKDTPFLHQTKIIDITNMSSNRSKVEGLTDMNAMKQVIAKLETELHEKSTNNSFLEAEIRTMQRKLQMKDAEINRQSTELHKLRSVLQQAASVMNNSGDDHLLSTLQEHCNPMTLTKKQGVSGQSVDPAKSFQAPKTEKDFRSKHLIREALGENDFLKNLSPSQMREIIDAMQLKKVASGAYVIREGDSGSHLYVSSQGEYEVIKDGKVLGSLGVGKAFGELAILYNCKRTASVKAMSPGEVWTLDRGVFQQIMMQTGMQKIEEKLTFLKSVPLFSKMSNDVLLRLSDALEMTVYKKGDYIVRQGTHGDTFYIISEGQVRVTKRVEGKREEEEIRFMSRGDYFGEQALLRTDFRTANVVANSATVECLVLDRESFFTLVGDMSAIKDTNYADVKGARVLKEIEIKKMSKEFEELKLETLEVIATLGVGGFGRVALVHLAKDKTRTFALKCLKKKHIVDTQQQEHVYSEKKIMMNCRHQFIARLYRTFKDRKYVYFLMEACLGGELWTILRDKGHFDDLTTRFYVACVVSALDYLHGQGIIYRDLKPENLLLDNHGYAKMVDFGFSKVIPEGRKTWTFCGTPEYVAPEIILNKGHDRAVDYWSLGVLMCELLMGTPPFTASDPMKIYNIILRGIEQIEFPRHVTKTAITIIRKFCRENPTERLGYQKDGINDVKKHRWYQGFDWEGLEARTLTPPIIPKIKASNDTSNFDSYPREEEIPPDEFSGWDKEF